MTARTLTCHVESVEDLTPDVFRVRFAARPEALAHAPGQYLEMKLDDTTWVRSFYFLDPDGIMLEFCADISPGSDEISLPVNDKGVKADGRWLDSLLA